MSKKTGPQRFDRIFNTAAETVQRASALFLSRLHPLFKPAVLRSFSFHTRLMTDQPEQRKICKGLAIHHSFEIKLEVGLAR